MNGWNQKRVDEELDGILEEWADVPGSLILEPVLEDLHIERYLASGKIYRVVCGGDTSAEGYPCHYEWILHIREQCVRYEVAFTFRTTGNVFIMNEKTYHIAKTLQEPQAEKAGINYDGRNKEHTSVSHEKWLEEDLFERLSRSKFRSRFHLKEADRNYVREKGMDTIRIHARDFVEKRLAPSVIPNDGKQTPMRGHPVFLAQHACACCCRGCLEKWHGIQPGTELTVEQQEYVVSVLMEWIRRQMLL